MKRSSFPVTFTRLVVAFGLVALAATAAWAADPDGVEAKVPFGFTAGTSSLPAGTYAMTTNWKDSVLKVHDMKTGKETVVPFLTALSAAAHPKSPDARFVFDKTADGSYTLAEAWGPEGEGVLVGMAKGKHEHEVITVKTKFR